MTVRLAVVVVHPGDVIDEFTAGRCQPDLLGDLLILLALVGAVQQVQTGVIHVDQLGGIVIQPAGDRGDPVLAPLVFEVEDEVVDLVEAVDRAALITLVLIALHKEGTLVDLAESTDWRVDLQRPAFAVELGVLGLQAHQQIVRGVPLQGAANEGFFDVRLFVVQDLVGEIALHLAIESHHAAPQGIGERPGQHGRQLRLLVLEFIGGGHPALEFIGRPGTPHADRTGDGVLAEQGGLWPAQNLDPVQVYQRHADELAAAVVNAVHVHRNRLLEALVGTGFHAADLDGAVDLVLGDIKIGHGTLTAQTGC